MTFGLRVGEKGVLQNANIYCTNSGMDGLVNQYNLEKPNLIPVVL